MPSNQSAPACAFTMVVKTLAGLDIPIGMLTVVPQFLSDVGGDKRERSFVWYLSDAPKAFYTNTLNVLPVKGVATALLDCAIQAGFDRGSDGSTLLHADPNGGKKLTEFYLGRCSMTQVQMNLNPSLMRRRNLDQYYFMDGAHAQRFSAQFDGLR